MRDALKQGVPILIYERSIHGKSDLINLTQRQFTDVMEREAIEIEDYYTHEKY